MLPASFAIRCLELFAGETLHRLTELCRRFFERADQLLPQRGCVIGWRTEATNGIAKIGHDSDPFRALGAGRWVCGLRLEATN